LKIRKRQEKNIVILLLEGKIDINSANFIEETGNLIKKGYNKILCDFSNVDMVDYNGLSIIVIAYKNVLNQKGIMKFCNIPPHVKELYKLIRLDLVFDVYDNQKQALSSFKTSTKIDMLHLRRRFKRLDLEVPVKFTSSIDSKRRTGKILNISAEGIFIYTKECLPVSSPIKLEINVINHKEVFCLRGEVVWVTDKDLEPHFYPGIGVKFMNIGFDEQKRIIDFIDKNITHRSEM